MLGSRSSVARTIDHAGDRQQQDDVDAQKPRLKKRLREDGPHQDGGRACDHRSPRFVRQWGSIVSHVGYRMVSPPVDLALRRWCRPQMMKPGMADAATAIARATAR